MQRFSDAFLICYVLYLIVTQKKEKVFYFMLKSLFFSIALIFPFKESFHASFCNARFAGSAPSLHSIMVGSLVVIGLLLTVVVTMDQC